MSDISGNPWNFNSTDQAASAVITAITRNGKGSALVTTTGHTFVVDQNISLQGNTPSGWNGGYRVLTVPSATTFLVGIAPQQSTLANATAFGSAYAAAYMQLVEVTQMLWDTPTANSKLLVTDLVGRVLWNPTAPNAGGSLTYMKAFPVFGLVVPLIGSGTLQVSV